MEKIVTDNKWKRFKGWYELPKKVRKDFNWITNPGYDSFIKYHGRWYVLSEFVRTPPTSDWHATHAEGFFSGVVIRVSPDGEEYQIGTWCA